MNLSNLKKKYPEEVLKWAKIWNHIKGDRIPKKKEKRFLADLKALKMGWDIRHSKEKDTL